MATTTLNASTAFDSKLKEFFIDQLKDIYWAEKKLVKTLPKLSQAATTNQLKDAIDSHLIETENHVARLEDVFDLVGVDADAKKCHAMAGIVEEGEDLIDETDTDTCQRDVALIFACQKAEHYEIATYGGLVTLAATLGYKEAAVLLRQTLEEEKAADAKLTQVAENDVNYKASQERE